MERGYPIPVEPQETGDSVGAPHVRRGAARVTKYRPRDPKKRLAIVDAEGHPATIHEAPGTRLWIPKAAMSVRAKFNVKASVKLRRQFCLDCFGVTWRKCDVRSTAHSRLRECPRKFMWSERFGLVPKTYTPALYIGQCAHLLWEFYFKGGTIVNFPDLMADEVRRLTTALTEAVGAGGLLPNGKTVGEVIGDAEKDSRMACAMISKWASKRPLEKFIETYEILGVELPLSIKVPVAPAPLTMTADVLVRNRATGNLWVVDHKTCGISPLLRAEVLKYEFQPRLYEFITDLSMSQYGKVAGTIHNIVQKPTIRQRTASGETWPQYCDRVSAWYDEQLTLYPESPPMVQSVIARGNRLLDEELLFQIIETAYACNAWPDLARFYRNDQACFGPFKNKPCPYLPLCSTEGHMETEWRRMIPLLFNQDFRVFEGNRTEVLE